VGALVLLKKGQAQKQLKLLEKATPAELKHQFILNVSRPLNKQDWELVEEALRRAKEKCKNRRSHTVCIARGRSGKVHGSPQLNCSRGREFSSCAESGAIAKSEWEGDIITTLVVVHFKPGLTRRSILHPCAACIERLRRFASPRCMTIVKYRGKIIKFPVSQYMMFFYPWKHGNKKNNT
jgi:cytidine deaminase